MQLLEWSLSGSCNAIMWMCNLQDGWYRYRHSWTAVRVGAVTASSAGRDQGVCFGWSRSIAWWQHVQWRGTPVQWASKAQAGVSRKLMDGLLVDNLSCLWLFLRQLQLPLDTGKYISGNKNMGLDIMVKIASLHTALCHICTKAGPVKFFSN